MEIKELFKKVYSYEPEHIFFAPGRVNLIGEHVDYNGGMVLPCALITTENKWKGDRDERKGKKWIHNGFCKSGNMDNYYRCDFYQCH